MAYAEGHNCTDNDDWMCSGNTFCNSNCSKTYDEGESCSRDAQCGVGFGCNFGECTRLFSLPLYSSAKYAKFCLTNFITDYERCESIDVYVNNLKLDYPYECLSGQTCRYRSANSQTQISKENCLLVSADKGYCGSNLLYNFDEMSEIYKELQYDTSICTGDKKHSGDPDELLDCKSISVDVYRKFIKIQKQMKFYNTYKSGILDSCATELEIFDPYYSSASGLTYGFILILLLS